MPTFSAELIQKAEQLLASLKARNLTLATAESCTGGMIATLLTEIPGSSEVFTHGFVTYANAAKSSMLGVPEPLINVHGAVSEKVAIAMAEDAQRLAATDLAIAVTGIAGPGGATATKPVGLVYLACARKGFSTLHIKRQFVGNRTEVRMQATAAALELVGNQLIR